MILSRLLEVIAQNNNPNKEEAMASTMRRERFFQARAAWHHVLAESVLSYNRCGCVLHGKSQISAVGTKKNRDRAITQFKELLKVIRQLTAHLKNDKHLRKSVSAGIADVLSNEFWASSKSLPKSVRFYMDRWVDFSERSRDYNKGFSKGQVIASNLVG